MGIMDDLASALGALNGFRHVRGVVIERGASKVMIPDEMPIKTAIAVLQQRLEEEEEEVELSDVIEAFPLDAAHALTLVLQEKYGIDGSSKTTVDTPFGQQTYSPQFISVEVGPGVTKQVPWGNFTIPGIEGTFQMGVVNYNERTVFRILATVKGRHRQDFADIVSEIRKKLATSSIYKGNAIRISFRDRDNNRVTFNAAITPKFMKLSEDQLPIFTKETQDQIDLSLLNPIRYTDRLRANGLKTRRTVLAEGDFGVGKTMLAIQVSLEAVRNGWTALLVDNVEDLDLAIELAKQYGPAVVIAEDADRIMGNDRDAELDRLSYVLDGMEKERDVMVVLTTNKIHDIQRLMIRPGRIDDIIRVHKPDLDTAWRLLDRFADGSLLGTAEDFKEAIMPLVGQCPAFIVEAVKKAKQRAISRSETVEVTPEDIRVAVMMMKNHIDLMNSDRQKSDDQTILMGELEVRVPSRVEV